MAEGDSTDRRLGCGGATRRDVTAERVEKFVKDELGSDMATKINGFHLVLFNYASTLTAAALMFSLAREWGLLEWSERVIVDHSPTRFV